MNSSSSCALSILVKILIPVGLLSTIGAIVLTLYALSNGLGQESNPYFDLGPTLFIIAGVFGGRRSKQKPNQNEYGRTFEDNAPSALYGSRMPQRNKLYLG
ncbi:MAG: hypothetical protein JRN15_17705 [Nitrososphaerota archaeon]|nr:hypothetical protein [Nitrososphaerota archaeon]